MKKIFKSKKGLMSLGAILIALTLVVGATFAWFQYVGSEEISATIDVGTLTLKTNFPTKAELDAQLDDALVNGVAQPGNVFQIVPQAYYDAPGELFAKYLEELMDWYAAGGDASGEPEPVLAEPAAEGQYFTVENTGNLPAMVRISAATLEVELNAALDSLGNYVGDADASNPAVTSFAGIVGKGNLAALKNGVIAGMKLAPAGIADNALIANTANDIDDINNAGLGEAILHQYDIERGDHYFTLDPGQTIAFSVFVDLKTNAYNKVVTLSGMEDRDPAILIDNKYQNSVIELGNIFGAKATQLTYRDAWMDIFGFFDGVGAWANAGYGFLDDEVSVTNGYSVPVTGTVDWLLPLAGFYTNEVELKGLGTFDPNDLVAYPKWW